MFPLPSIVLELSSTQLRGTFSTNTRKRLISCWIHHFLRLCWPLKPVKIVCWTGRINLSKSSTNNMEDVYITCILYLLCASTRSWYVCVTNLRTLSEALTLFRTAPQLSFTRCCKSLHCLSKTRASYLWLQNSWKFVAKNFDDTERPTRLDLPVPSIKFRDYLVKNKYQTKWRAPSCWRNF